MKIFLAISCVITTSLALSALPPLFQSRKEISSLLTHEIVEKNLKHREIKKISKKVGKDGQTYYQVKAKNCKVQLNINYLPLPDGMVGPARFELSERKVSGCE